MRVTLGPGIRVRLSQSEAVDVVLSDEYSATSATADVMFRGVKVGDTLEAAGTPPLLSASDLAPALAEILGDAEIVWTVQGGPLPTVKTRIEVVEGYYFSIRELREHNGDADGFGKEDRYPDDAVFAARQAAHEVLENAANRSWTRRGRLASVRWGGGLVELPDVDVEDIDSIELGGLDISDSSELVSDCQIAVRSLYRGLLKIAYVYGIEAAPVEVRRAALKLAASYLRISARAENARAESIDGLYTSYVLATGKDGTWTGIPEVDAVIERFGRRRKVVG